MKVKITHIDTACILLEINGFKIMTDPTLDNAGGLYHHGFGAFSRKTDNPAIEGLDLSNVDLVLLSHHQHKDNFDNKGKEFAKGVPLILSTVAAGKAVEGVTGLAEWQEYQVATDKLSNLRITATPAQHHPGWLPQFISGKVVGFVIEYDEQTNGVIYISGDTVYFKGIDEIGKRYKIDVGIFHVGCVQFRYLSGLGKYTMSSQDLVKTVGKLQPNTVIPIHHKGWSHFQEKESLMQKTLTGSALTRDKTVFLESGVGVEV